MACLLVVDDEPDILDTMARVLRRRFELTLVDGGEAAVAELRTRAFDAALVDYAMPGMNGLEVCRVAAELQPAMRRIMVTAHVGVAAIHAARDRGLLHALVFKPWSRAELVSVIEAELDARGGGGG